MLVRSKKRPDIFALVAFLLTVSLLLNSCVSKSKADAQTRMAFLAGQQQATMRMQQMQQPQQARGPNVTFTGPVQNFMVAWRVGLMLTQAIVSANYLGHGDPSAIVIHRSGQDIPIDAKQLLKGEDFLLEAGDVIEFRQ
jgi:hypothetical protein